MYNPKQGQLIVLKCHIVKKNSFLKFTSGPAEVSAYQASNTQLNTVHPKIFPNTRALLAI